MHMWEHGGGAAGPEVGCERGAPRLTSRRTRRPCRPRHRSPVRPHVRSCRVRSPCPPWLVPAAVVRPIRHARGAGVDVHQPTGVAGVVTPHGPGGWGPERRPVGPMPLAWRARADGQLAWGGVPVAIERTGADGPPGCNRLEGRGAVRLGQAPPVQAVPGRQTAVPAAAGRAALVPHGVWRARVIPPVAPRARRDLTRDGRPVIQARVPRMHRGPTRCGRRGAPAPQLPRAWPRGRRAASAAHGTRGRPRWRAG
jgi:hypothetical protein